MSRKETGSSDEGEPDACVLGLEAGYGAAGGALSGPETRRVALGILKGGTGDGSSEVERRGRRDPE